MYELLIAAGAATFAMPAAEAAPDTAGPRIEARIGYDQVDLSGVADSQINARTFADRAGALAYGAEAGFDFALRSGLTVGPYASIDLSDASYEEVRAYSDGRVWAEYTVEAARTVAVGLRLAMLTGRDVNFFVKGGYANGDLSVRYSETIEPGFNNDAGFDRSGFQLGTGIEVPLGAAYVKGEMSYTSLPTVEYDLGPDFSARLDGDRLNVMTGIGLRF
ncbi:outer membrane beta-barrel protein [Sphingomicrobium aestuariivivum]|nr:outer membrane beta-barrel protein [Sphingomicrobium aestuariivivum]MCJ8190122.1 outer membrane beta-barrel protein [Sphingomicrobium aestuariivivum]